MINKKLKIIIIIAILLLAVVIRLIPIRIAHFWDETVYLQHAEIMLSGRTNFDELSFRPPLLSMIFFVGFLFKHSVVTASVLTAILGALASLFLFLIGKKMYGEKAGIVAGLIFAVVPFLTLNSNYLLTDIPVITLIAVSFYLILFRDKKYLVFLSGVFFSLAVLMKFNALLMILVFSLYFYLNKFKLKEMMLFCLGAALIMLPYLIWCQVKFGNFLTPFIVGQGMVSDRNEPTFFYLFNMVKAFSFLVPIGLALGLFNSGVRISRKEYPDWKKDLVLFFWVVLFFVYLTITPHKELRYILPITAPIILLSAKGIANIYERLKKPLKLLAVILFVFSLLFLASHTYAWENIRARTFVDRTITDEMKIADYLREINYTGIIYSNQRWPVLAYYTGLETRLLVPYNSDFYALYTELMKDPGLLIGMFNAEEPQPNWLEQNSHFKHFKNMGEFFIYEYNPNDSFQ